MATGWTEQELPWAGSSPLAAHCSRQGANHASTHAQTQTLAYLELLAKRGPTTDAEAASLLGLQRSSINARRGALTRRGIVVAVDTVVNDQTGVRNTRWGLR